MTRHTLLKEKMREAAASVLPIAAIVAVLCLFLVPVSEVAGLRRLTER